MADTLATERLVLRDWDVAGAQAVLGAYGDVEVARAMATVRRIGMEWVGESQKYHRLRLEEYRLRPGDLARLA